MTMDRRVRWRTRLLTRLTTWPCRTLIGVALTFSWCGLAASQDRDELDVPGDLGVAGSVAAGESVKAKNLSASSTVAAPSVQVDKTVTLGANGVIISNTFLQYRSAEPVVRGSKNQIDTIGLGAHTFCSLTRMNVQGLNNQEAGADCNVEMFSPGLWQLTAQVTAQTNRLACTAGCLDLPIHSQ